MHADDVRRFARSYKITTAYLCVMVTLILLMVVYDARPEVVRDPVAEVPGTCQPSAASSERFT